MLEAPCKSVACPNTLIISGTLKPKAKGKKGNKLSEDNIISFSQVVGSK